MRYPYLDAVVHVYPEYRDAETGLTLVAEPGNSYDIEPCGGQRDPVVPPADNRWGDPEDEQQDDEKAPEPDSDKLARADTTKKTDTKGAS